MSPKLLWAFQVGLVLPAVLPAYLVGGQTLRSGTSRSFLPREPALCATLYYVCTMGAYVAISKAGVTRALLQRASSRWMAQALFLAPGLIDSHVALGSDPWHEARSGSRASGYRPQRRGIRYRAVTCCMAFTYTP